LTLYGLYGVISQKIEVFFITTAVRTSNPTDFSLLRSVQTSSGAHPASYQICNGWGEVKCLGLEADQSL
jgi:hypothetical protein